MIALAAVAAGWVDERLASEDEVLDAVREVMDAHLECEQRALFERFSAEHGTNGRAAAGLERVLASLVETKVETLLVREPPKRRAPSGSPVAGSGRRSEPLPDR